MNEQELNRLSKTIADKIELDMRRSGTWPIWEAVTWPPLPHVNDRGIF